VVEHGIDGGQQVLGGKLESIAAVRVMDHRQPQDLTASRRCWLATLARRVSGNGITVMGSAPWRSWQV
jgi:hypothetical protein